MWLTAQPRPIKLGKGRYSRNLAVGPIRGLLHSAGREHHSRSNHRCHHRRRTRRGLLRPIASTGDGAATNAPPSGEPGDVGIDLVSLGTGFLDHSGWASVRVASCHHIDTASSTQMRRNGHPPRDQKPPADHVRSGLRLQ